jgi:hypothetical protein
MFEESINGENALEDWKIAYNSTTHRKSIKDECSNHRGISLTSTFSQLHARVKDYF